MGDGPNTGAPAPRDLGHAAVNMFSVAVGGITAATSVLSPGQAAVLTHSMSFLISPNLANATTLTAAIMDVGPNRQTAAQQQQGVSVASNEPPKNTPGLVPGSSGTKSV